MISDGGQTLVTTTSAAALPADPAQLLLVEPGTVRSRLMERIGNEVERRLAQTGGGEALALTEITRAWLEAVGSAIARNAWPLRVGRDGTLHVATSSATWAFELDRMSPDIIARLREMLAEEAPARVRFQPGPVPEPGREQPAEALDEDHAALRGAHPRDGGSGRLSRGLDRGRGPPRARRASGQGEPRKERGGQPVRPRFLVDYSVPAKWRFAGLF